MIDRHRSRAVLVAGCLLLAGCGSSAASHSHATSGTSTHATPAGTPAATTASTASTASTPATSTTSASGLTRSLAVSEITTQLNADGLQGLSGCAAKAAGALTDSQLQAVANASKHPTAATRALELKLDLACVATPQGATFLRGRLVTGIDSSAATAGTHLPKAYLQCAVAKTRNTSAAELKHLVTVYAEQGATAGRAAAFAFGRRLGVACLGDPRVLASLRPLFIGKIRAAFAQSHYSSDFVHCIDAKVPTISSKVIVQLIVDPKEGAAAARAFGKTIAQECIDEGHRP